MKRRLAWANLFERKQVPRTATVKSKTLCTTISLRDEDLASLVAKDAAFGSEIMSASNKRMQAYLERNVLA